MVDGLIGPRRVSTRRYGPRKPHVQVQGLAAGWTRPVHERLKAKRIRQARRILDLRS